MNFRAGLAGPVDEGEAAQVGPQEQQALNYPEALGHSCPICGAAKEEPCRPMSLSMPHQARVELGEALWDAEEAV